jgi:hypothetical protein
MVGRADFEPFGRGLLPSGLLRPDGMDALLVRAAIARHRDLRRFLGWSILPVAIVERGQCQARIVIGDGRYFRPGSIRSRLERETILPLDGPGC